jgi:hypothetical protein
MSKKDGKHKTTSCCMIDDGHPDSKSNVDIAVETCANGINVIGKKPSEELVFLIMKVGSSVTNTRNLVKNVKKKGLEEGFNNFEITLLARDLLRPSLTKRQLNYWFPIRSNTRKIQNIQKVHNIENKDKAQFPVAFVLPSLLQSAPPFPDQREATSTINPPATREKILIEKHEGKTSGRISFSDVIDPESAADSTIYQPSLHHHKCENQNSSPNENPNDGSSDFFQVSKNCDFVKEHFRPRIDPIEAIEYLQRFVGKCQKIDFAFRVVE